VISTAAIDTCERRKHNALFFLRCQALANSPSAAKRARQNEGRRQRNMAHRSRVRTYVKRVASAVTAGDAEAAQSTLRAAESELDRAATKGIFHKNTVARLKSRLVRRVKAIS